MYANLPRQLGLFIVGLYIVLLAAQPVSAQLDASRAEIAGCSTGISYYESWTKSLPCFSPRAGYSEHSLPSQPPAEGLLPQAPSGVYECTELVYSSFRDGNWEVYFDSNPWGSSGLLYSRRVTDHPASDLRPKLRPGSRQIAFYSNRSGNYEVYLIEWDSSNLRALTNHPAYDSQPAWSPDGSMLAFVSDRDGNLEIYTMQADGSSLTRQTFDAADDFHPGWSPDGKGLIWVRAVSDYDGVVYRMPAGSGSPQAITPPLRYAQHPIWSPSLVALDYDGSGDGWSDIGLMNSDGSQLHVQALSPGSVDYFTGSWTHLSDPPMVVNRIKYILYEGVWYVEQACLGNFYTSGTNVSCLAYSDLDFYPNAALIDLLPPTSQVLPMPRFQRAGTIPITFNANDAGLAGLYLLWLQKRSGLEDDWSTFLTVNQFQTLPNTYYLNVNGGETIYFRSRAMDYADHLEDWPPGDGDAFTHIYNWELSGRVVDNRDHGLAFASVNSSPEFFAAADTDFSGNFTRYVPIDAISMTVSQPGYGVLPPVQLSSSVDLDYHLVIPPAQDILQNGSFEDSLSGWSVSGEYPPVASAAAHSGSGAAQLGLSLGGAALDLATGVEDMRAPKAVVDSTGSFHAAWIGRQDLADVRLYYTNNISGSWSPPALMSPLINGSPYSVDLAIGDDDTIHAVWLDRAYDQWYVRYTSKAPEGEWAESVDISGKRILEYTNADMHAEIVLDTSGTLHVVWFDREGTWYVQKQFGGSWSTPYLITAVADNYTIVLDSFDNLHIIYQDYEVFHRMRTSTGVWSAPVHTGFQYGFDMDAVAGDSGKVHLVFNYDQIKYTTRNPGGDWDPPVQISVNSGHNAALSVVDGLVHVIWDSPSGLAYRREYNPDTWSPIVTGNTPVKDPFIVVFGEEVHAFYLVEEILGHVVYDRWTLPQQGSSQLAQAVSIPADMHKPTLSFLYNLEQAGAFSLTVTVSDTLVYSSSAATSEWQHIWVDMSPWIGVNVTVTFKAQVDLLQEIWTSRLDGVSVGSWMTPLVNATLPEQIDAYVATAITITGINFLPTPQVLLNGQSTGSVTWLDHNTLRLDLPVGIPPGRYELWVVNPGGAFGVWNGKLNAGEQIYLPAILR